MNILELHLMDDPITLGQVPKLQPISIRQRDGTGSNLKFSVHHVEERNQDILNEIPVAII
jgi:hypothetical protein